MNRKVLMWVILLCGTVLIHGKEVRGAVFSREGSSPLNGAVVTVTADSLPPVSTCTGTRGDFSVTLPREDGVFIIDVSCPGYETHNVSLVNPPELTDLGKIFLAAAASTLDEVVVNASAARVIDLADKSIVYPTGAEKERATNPLNLLAQMSFAIPSLSVDEFAKSISVEGLSPQILINGVKRGYPDLNALSPEEILRIEYVTYPDIRYGMPYLNIVTSRPPTGGAVMAEVSAPVTSRQENHQGYASYRRGRHEVSVNYNGTFRDSRKEHEELTERYFSPDTVYEYDLSGLPSRLLDRSHSVSAEYSLLGGPMRMLVITGGLSYHSQHRLLRQECDNVASPFLRDTRQRSKTVNPNLNLYGSLPISGDGRLEMNVAYNYQRGDYLRSLHQTDGYSESTTTKSGSHSIGGDIYYSHRFPWSSLNVGLTQSFTHASNSYDVMGQPVRQRLDRSVTRAYAALGGQPWKALSYYAAVGLTHTKVEEGETTPYAYLMLRSRLGAFVVRYSLSTTSASPALSSLNDVVLPVNELLYQAGNMHLRDALSIHNGLAASYSVGKFSTLLDLGYLTQRKGVITVCGYVGDSGSPLHGRFFQTTENSRRHDNLGVTLTAGLYELLDHYSVRVSGSYVNERTVGYGHEWKNRRLNVSGAAAAYFGNWQFSARLGLMPSYSLIGNMLWRDFTSWGVAASWHKGPWSCSCTLADLFNRKAFYQEKTLMAIDHVSKSASWIGDKNNWIELSVRYYLSFGKRQEKPQRNINGTTGSDSGVGVSY